ncbi:hypothetical protein DSAG12_02562 [Promethearchaeum syntrophicum]|uniref:Histidine kinase N-terminal 7TM region domain-containing protein n=1 Tax=Promethearchaeum syntrophicum TaxID=2594042 RepID=A0A5B9DC80_9ARCH|nr:hypothetical protein [Candidatus Prometheoarchaeum syntrophicum]QEE16732.1 hypothetical protein DSAG12_02562 [Candidatus Prometheoarchaeum syntrophicum]
MILTLNWNIEVFNYFLAAFLMLISGTIMFREYLKVKHRFHYLIVIIWDFVFLYMALGGVALLIQSRELFKWEILILIPATLLLIYVLDSFYRGSLDPIKTLLFGFSAAGVIISSLSSEAIKPIFLASGSPSFQTNDVYHTWLSIFTAQIALLYFVFCLMIFIKAPKSLKKKASLTLLGGFFFGIFSFVFYITRLTKILPGIMMISIGLGALISSLSFALEPQLLKILIFSADKAKAKIIGNILSICAHCKKIKDDEGNWHQIEQYFSDHSKLLFSHGLCADCIKQYYTDEKKKESS